MEPWLEQETLRFVPLSGTFDETLLAERIGTLGFSFRDVADPSTFIVAESAEARDSYAERRLQQPEGGFPYTLLIEITPNQVLVTPPISDELRPLWREFVTWLVGQVPCRVINEFGTDVTEACHVAA
jgi:hypothetical protein